MNRILLYILIGLGAAQTAPPVQVSTSPGLYYESQTRLQRIEGQVVSFGRTGSLLASAATFGIRSRKFNAQVLGPRSRIVTAKDPSFYFRGGAANVAAGGSAGDLVLLKFKVKGDRRQFELGAQGTGRASAGISIRSQVGFHREEVSEGLYHLTTASPLKPGQYGFFLFRGYDLPGFIYDFAVE